MVSTTSFATPWLASACPAAVVTARTKLPHGEVTQAQAGTELQPGWAGYRLGATASHGTLAYLPVRMGRPMGDEQINRTAVGGARGPRHAWRALVRT